ncbi:lipopolysaccharide kinase InaA family protein [Pseudomonas aeruginosa]|uniref:lipopolysaccharide kinase InaA family protein n=1 Tax=Pseudomonas aeruginosa TaxID=287 RepID=UPI003977B444
MTEALEGFSSLDECYARGDQDRWASAKHQRILQQIGATIARGILPHWQHTVVSIRKHIFVRSARGEAEVALIDLEKSRPLTVNKASQHDLKQLKRRFVVDWRAVASLHLWLPDGVWQRHQRLQT